MFIRCRRLDHSQGMLELLYGDAADFLAEISGTAGRVALQPAAGAQGELTALFVAAAYFRDKGQERRGKVLVPDERPRHQPGQRGDWPGSKR